MIDHNLARPALGMNQNAKSVVHSLSKPKEFVPQSQDPIDTVIARSFGNSFGDVSSQFRRLVSSQPILAIGDIHGHLESLLHILRSAGLVDQKGSWLHSGQHLIFTGDYFDKGPCGFQTYRYLKRLKNEAPDHITLLLGNHEITNLADEPYFKETFDGSGMNSFDAFKHELMQDILAGTFQACHTDGRRFFSHAGLHPQMNQGIGADIESYDQADYLNKLVSKLNTRLKLQVERQLAFEKGLKFQEDLGYIRKPNFLEDDPMFFKGKAKKGGDNVLGGIFWLEGEKTWYPTGLSTPFPQVNGHTKVDKDESMGCTYVANEVCIDIGMLSNRLGFIGLNLNDDIVSEFRNFEFEPSPLVHYADAWKLWQRRSLTGNVVLMPDHAQVEQALRTSEDVDLLPSAPLSQKPIAKPHLLMEGINHIEYWKTVTPDKGSKHSLFLPNGHQIRMLSHNLISIENPLSHNGHLVRIRLPESLSGEHALRLGPLGEQLYCKGRNLHIINLKEILKAIPLIAGMPYLSGIVHGLSYATKLTSEIWPIVGPKIESIAEHCFALNYGDRMTVHRSNSSCPKIASISVNPTSGSHFIDSEGKTMILNHGDYVELKNLSTNDSSSLKVDRVRAIAVSSVGRKVALQSLQNKSLLILDLDKPVEKSTLEASTLCQIPVSCVAFSHEGRYLAAITSCNRLIVYDLNCMESIFDSKICGTEGKYSKGFKDVHFIGSGVLALVNDHRERILYRIYPYFQRMGQKKSLNEAQPGVHRCVIPMLEDARWKLIESRSPQRYNQDLVISDYGHGRHRLEILSKEGAGAKIETTDVFGEGTYTMQFKNGLFEGQKAIISLASPPDSSSLQDGFQLVIDGGLDGHVSSSCYRHSQNFTSSKSYSVRSLGINSHAWHSLVIHWSKDSLNISIDGLSVFESQDHHPQKKGIFSISAEAGSADTSDGFFEFKDMVLVPDQKKLLKEAPRSVDQWIGRFASIVC